MFHFEPFRSAFRGYIRSLRCLLNYRDIDRLHSDIREDIFEELNTSLVLRLRIVICISVLFFKNIDQEEVYQSFYFNSNTERILSPYEIFPAIDRAFDNLKHALANFILNGSGWRIKNIEFLDIHIGNYVAWGGGCGSISLPIQLKNKKALLNIKCNNHMCFLYCVLAKLYPVVANSNIASKYDRFLANINYSLLKFPVTIDQIAKFEKLNKLQINVYGYTSNIYPIYKGKTVGKKIKLLLYKKHYFLIKNFNRLLNKKNGVHHFCENCLSGFQRRTTLQDHEKLCVKNVPQKIAMPLKENSILKFKNVHKMLYHPFVVFCDFESMLRPFSNAMQQPTKTFSTPIEEHVPYTYFLIVLDINDTIIFQKYYQGRDVIQNFLSVLKKISKKLIAKMHEIAPMKGEIPRNKSVCHICEKPFLSTDVQVLDHCHFTYNDNNIRGFSHVSCNLNLRTTFFLPIYFHNLSGYDLHYILKEVNHHVGEKISIIPVNTQRFSVFQIDEMKFMDTMQFLNASLATLVETLKSSNHNFPLFNSYFKHLKNRHLLQRKNTFPYSYFSDEKVLKHTKFPPKSAFFNKLTNSAISQNDYEHELLIYKTFNLKNFGDYLELYQRLDVIFLGEVFTSFRRKSMKYWRLDPVYFVSTANLAWDACLCLTKVEIQLFTDVNMFIWLEGNIRGGVVTLGDRYAKANNPYLSSYDPTQEHSYIITLDAINLYGYCLQSFLPYGNFKWLRQDEIECFNLFDIPPDSTTGYFLEVTLEYPKNEIQDFHNDFPLAPQHIKVEMDMLSLYQKNLLKNENIKFTNYTQKLIPNFYTKRNYVTHYLNLQYYLKQGMVLKKIHRILSFHQKSYLKPYISFNNEKRQQTDNRFERDLLKLMNNGIFGKSIANNRKRIDMQGAFTPEQCSKKLSSPLLEYFESINESFAVFKMKKKNLFLNSPIFIGYTVLELAKLHMYKLYYSHLKKHYQNNCNLLYTDTDSFFLNIKTDDIYSDMNKKFPHILDLSNFPTNHIAYNSQNMGKLGCLKNESCTPIKEFVALKCKMYCISYEDSVKKTAKGIKKSTLSRISSDDYKNVLFNQLNLKHTQVSIKSQHHNLKTVLENRKSLNCFFDKKYILQDGIKSLSFGHYLIEESEE